MDRRRRMMQERKAKAKALAQKKAAQAEKDRLFAEKDAARKAKREANTIQYEGDGDDGRGDAQEADDEREASSSSDDESSSSDEEEEEQNQGAKSSGGGGGADGGGKGAEDGQGGRGGGGGTGGGDDNDDDEEDGEDEVEKIDFELLANREKKKTKKQLAREKREKKAARQEKERIERESMDPKTAAYRAFSMIDADGSGRVTVRELARFISGNLIEDFDCVFPLADTGMKFGNNSRRDIVVESMEHGSPADKHPDMDPGLTLVAVNGESFGTRRGNLKLLRKFMKTIPEGTNVIFTFKEPAFVTGDYSRCIDIEVEGRPGVHAISLEPKAYTLVEDFLDTVRGKMAQKEALQGVHISYLADEQRVCFTTSERGLKVRLRGETGPSSNMNCHAILGFGQHDTAFEDELVGLSKSMDLRLGLSVTDTKEVAQELMNLFDENKNQLFEFDEFVDLYSTYLASEQHIEKLREYCRLRFRSKEQVQADKDRRRELKRWNERAAYLVARRPRNKKIADAQKDFRRKLQYQAHDGSIRRWTTRHIEQQKRDKLAEERKRDSWSGLMGDLGVKVSSGKTKKGAGIRRMVAMTAAKLLRKSVEEVDKRAGKNAAIDEDKAVVMKAARDEQRKKRRKLYQRTQKRRAQKARKERDAAREVLKHQEWEKKKNIKQMTAVGMESLVEEALTGTDVASPCWLGFIPLKQPARRDPSTRSPAFFGNRFMRPVNEVSVGNNFVQTTCLVEDTGFARANHVSPPAPPPPLEAPTQAQGEPQSQLTKDTWGANFWDFVSRPKPGWMVEHAFTTTKTLRRAYAKSEAERPRVYASTTPFIERKAADGGHIVRAPPRPRPGALTQDRWAEMMWEWVSQDKPEWMMVAKDRAAMATMEHEYEQHNRGLREKNKAELANNASGSEQRSRRRRPRRQLGVQRHRGNQHGETSGGDGAQPSREEMQAHMLEEEQRHIHELRGRWFNYPANPMNRGKVRQQFNEFGDRYDRGGIVHPACAGYAFVQDRDHAEFIHPAFLGYELRRAPLDQPLKRAELFFRMRAGDNATVCPVCLIGKTGCPYCWDFPDDWEPKDFEFKGSRAKVYGEEVPDVELHTNLTTHDAIALYRHEKMDLVDLYIKTIPAGPVAKFTIDKFATVGYLHFMHRTNTIFGNREKQVIVLPLMRGMYFFDNELKPETDVNMGIYTTDVQLQRYGLRRNKSKVVLLHYVLESASHMLRPLQHFLTHNTYMMRQPSMNIIHNVGGLPNELPGDDLLQATLFDLFHTQYLDDQRRVRDDVALAKRELAIKMNSELEAAQWLELNRKREERNAEYMERKAAGLHRRKGGGFEGGMRLRVVQRPDEPEEDELPKDIKMAKPRYAGSDCTITNKLKYHMRIPDLAVAQEHLQHLAQMNHQLAAMQKLGREDKSGTVKLNARAFAQMKEQIEYLHGELKQIQDNAMNQKRYTSPVGNYFELQRIEGKMNKLQDAIRKAHAIQTKNKRLLVPELQLREGKDPGLANASAAADQPPPAAPTPVESNEKSPEAGGDSDDDGDSDTGAVE